MRLAVPLLAVSLVASCLRFSEDQPKVSDAGCVTCADASPEAAADSSAPEVGADAPNDSTADVAPPMCDRYGYPLVEGAMVALIPKLQTDCRLQRQFAGVPAVALSHMRECMALQLGSIMRCTRAGAPIKYPGPDSKGVLCRDMRTSHQSLGIQAWEFDAMVEDVLAVLADAKVAADDLTKIGDMMRYQRTDIVRPDDAGRPDGCPSDAAAD